MKKRNIIITTILLPFLIFWLGSFHFSKTYLIGRDIPFKCIRILNVDFWKALDGYGITGRDFLERDGDWGIKNDTLYIEGKPTAKVISLVSRCFMDYELTIQSFDGEKIGSYVSK